MKKELTSSIDIDAPPPRGVGHAGRLRRVPTWNPFITSAVGPLPGRRPAHGPPAAVLGPAVTLRPSVIEVVQRHRLHWRGRLGVRGLFDADHLFLVEPRATEGSRLVQHEQFSGLLVPIFRASLDRGTLPAFHAMNQALKVRAEAATTASD